MSFEMVEDGGAVELPLSDKLAHGLPLQVAGDEGQDLVGIEPVLRLNSSADGSRRQIDRVEVRIACLDRGVRVRKPRG